MDDHQILHLLLEKTQGSHHGPIDGSGPMASPKNQEGFLLLPWMRNFSLPQEFRAYGVSQHLHLRLMEMFPALLKGDHYPVHPGSQDSVGHAWNHILLQNNPAFPHDRCHQH